MSIAAVFLSQKPVLSKAVSSRLVSARFVLTAILLATATTANAAAPRLGEAGADIYQTSVSGLSSGAFMTSQLYVAHSDIMVGAGVVAGGPYLCSRNWENQWFGSGAYVPLLNVALYSCMDPTFPLGVPVVSTTVSIARTLDRDKLIDPLNNLADDHIYIFSGKSDNTVKTSVVNTTRDFFTRVGVPSTSIDYDSSVDAGHAIITNNSNDIACATTADPYINDCDFVQAERILKQIYPAAQGPETPLSRQVQAFDQSEFLSTNLTSMASTGYVYIPEYCEQNGGCAIHVALHGCEQSADSFSADGIAPDRYYNTTGYNEMAEANHMIVLYPQVNRSEGIPYNPKGCWDFWGYSSALPALPDFYTRNAPQIKALYSMIQRLSGARPVTTNVLLDNQ